MMFEQLFDEEIQSIQKIEEGFSVDEKYLVNNKYFIRVIKKDRFERFQNVFDFQQKFHKVALCQKPIKFEIIDGVGYYVTEYLKGENGLDAIRKMSPLEQRELGIKAGFELSKVHKAYPVPEFDVKGYLDQYYNSKVQVAIDHNVEVDLPEINDIIKRVGENLHYLYDLEGMLTHSDYHLFNMIVDDGNYQGVIDFERCRTGIFLTDFRNNTPHNSDVSKEFASAVIDGYLDECPMEHFFLMYNVHDLLVTIAAIPWVKQYNPENLEVDIMKIRKIYNDSKNLHMPPAWYIGKY